MPETESKPLDVALGIESLRRSRMDRFIDGIELIAALFVGIVAADIFISVLLRDLFSVQIPDSYAFGQQLLGILIFWGIAATSYRGTHITVDLVYANVGPKFRRFIDVFEGESAVGDSRQGFGVRHLRTCLPSEFSGSRNDRFGRIVTLI